MFPNLTILFAILYLTYVNTQELQRLESLFSCNYDSDCNTNGFCYGNDENTRGKCRCKDNNVMTFRNRTYIECLPYADGIDAPCVKDLQCQINMGILAVCDIHESKCKCGDGSHYAEDNRCYRIASIDELCESNFNCFLSENSYGFCVNGRCACNIKQHYSKELQKCIPTSLLEEDCVIGESCSTKFSDCYNGTCKCLAGYAKSIDLRCLKAASQTGDPCEESIQCSTYISGSFCDNNYQCACGPSKHGYGNECVIDVSLRGLCYHDKECILRAELKDSVKCKEGTCQCVQGVNKDNDCNIVNSAYTTNYFVPILGYVTLINYLVH